MIQLSLMELLASGRPAFGISIRYRDPAIMETIAAGWDFAWLDLQHGTMTAGDVPGILRAADLLGISAFVRTAACQDPATAAWVMDMDPAGIIAAQVDTMDEARSLVRALKLPPLGNRSYGGRRIIDRHSSTYIDRANREQLLFAQIESPEALAIVQELAALPGIDGLMIGPDDLRLRTNQPITPELYDPVMRTYHRAITDAARTHGKWALGFASPAPETLQAAIDSGYHLISVTADVSLLKERGRQIQGVLDPVRKDHRASR